MSGRPDRAPGRDRVSWLHDTDESGVSPVWPVRTEPLSETQRREIRIIKCTRDLLIQRGYPRVTIEDIARRARLGKGTVYLHWESKADLVADVLYAESVTALTRMVRAMRAESRELLFHRMARLNFLGILEQPLYRALYLGDREALGRLIDEPAESLVRFRTRFAGAYERYFAILAEARLIADDVEFGVAMTAVDALCSGLVRQWQNVARAAPQSAPPQRLEDVLAFTVLRAFGPRQPPHADALHDVWRPVVAVFDDLLQETVTVRPLAASAAVADPLPPPR